MRATEYFLRLIWPSAGEKAIVSINKGQPRHFWYHPDQIKEAATKADELARAGIDVYMALAGFDTDQRKADHAIALKSLYLDIDCGDGKPYPEAAAGRSALDAFLHATGLPTPLVISSGFGLHVYWPLDHDISREEWLPLAIGLKQLCVVHQLQVDEKVTADAARILRPIGTFNYKNGEPRRVAALQAGEAISATTLTPLLQTPGVFEALAQRQAGAAKVQSTSFSDHVPVEFDDILPHCATLRFAYEHQDEVPEPLWYAVLGLANYCTNPTHTAHRVSSRHPAYDPSHTERKQQHWASAASGPPTCDAFRTTPGHRCAGCHASVSTPIQLGRPKGAVSLTQLVSGAQAFTHPWLRLNGHGLQVQVQGGRPDKDGKMPPPEWIRVSEYGIRPLLNVRLPDKEGKSVNHVWMESYDANQEPRTQFVVPATAVNNSTQFSTECARYGLVNEQEVYPQAFRSFTTIMRNWINTLEKRQGAAISFDSFGWMGPEGAHDKDSFLLGNKLYTRDDIRTVPVLPHLREYQEAMAAHGSLEEWTKAIDNYNLPGMEAYMFTSWAAWGAPLMPFTNSRNILVSLVGDTGVGKSSLQRAISSVYGDYNSNILLDMNNSTINSVNANLGCLNSLPYCRDEGTETDHDELASWVLTMTQGREKGRLTSSLTKAAIRTWSTIAVLSSNTSLREIVVNTRRDNAARLARAWEANITLPISSEQASKLFRPLQDNYGLAGPIYIDFIVKNKEAVARAVRELEERLTKRYGATGGDRFYISYIAACMVGAKIALQLGLIHHDIRRGRDWALRQYVTLRQHAIAEQRSPEQVLATLLQELRPTTIVVEKDAPKQGDTFMTQDNILHMPTAHSVINARYAVDTCTFYVSMTYMRKWYVDNHLNYALSLATLKQQGILIAEDKKIVLTKSTKYSDNHQTRCNWFDLTKSTELVESLTEDVDG